LHPFVSRVVAGFLDEPGSRIAGSTYRVSAFIHKSAVNLPSADIYSPSSKSSSVFPAYSWQVKKILHSFVQVGAGLGVSHARAGREKE